MKWNPAHHAIRITGVAVLMLIVAVAAGAAPDWVARSDENAAILLDVLARFHPEFAGQWGIDGLDGDVFQLPLDANDRNVHALEKAISQLEERKKSEDDPAVLQDLDILIDAARDQIEEIRVTEQYMLPYFNIPQAMFFGVRALLDDQIPAERRPAALVRLRKYAGLEKGYSPLVDQAIAFTKRNSKNKKLMGPYKGELERDLSNTDRMVAGIDGLCQKYGVTGYETALAELKKQIDRYATFLRDDMMPRAREDFRQPPAVYALGLKGVGIDMPVEELTSRAKVSFREIQNEMQSLAPLVAKDHGIKATDYRDVIRELKKRQIVGDAILPHYQARIKALEKLIRDNNVITLPDREMSIRLASEAESAAIPAPHMRPPRMIGNTGEMGEFVLPLRIPGDNEEDIGFDDFTFDAMSWTLTVHEGRPGHELQFASMVETGVSQARALFAFNSVNVEGWALYAEAEMKPLLPLDGQLGALQSRLARAARAFLDPGLQSGEITRDEAFRILEEEVVLSHAMALQEVERYTFMAPGQATSYFCGYTRLMELRADTERLLGDRFDRRAFHDFVLAQGLLPPRLMRKAVLDDFIPSQRGDIDRGL